MLTAVSDSALMASASISLDPAAIPFFRVLNAFLILVLYDLLQSIGRSVWADCMSGDVSGVGLFNSSSKCSTHLSNCYSVALRGLPLLSFTGLSVRLTC